MTYVLIIIFSSSAPAFTMEFKSKPQCEAVFTDVSRQAKTYLGHFATIGGCYERE